MRFILLLTVFLFFSAPGLAKDITREFNGQTVSAHLVAASDDWQNAPVVLMLHGTLAHSKMEIMAALQQALLDNDISSLAINLGLGQSNRTGMYECATPHRHKHTDSIGEIGLWVDWLKQQGVKSIILLGHSRGGNQIAWYASENSNDTIQQVVLVAPAIVSPGDLAKDYQKNYKKPLQPLLAQAQSMVAAGNGGELIQKTDFIYCPETAVSADAFVNYYEENANFYTPSLVEKIKRPVMIFAGTEDKVVDNVETEMAAVAQREDVELIMMDGADHFFRDLYAEEIAERLAETVE